ncbi:hypothetical protein TELCIR_02406 [Teladorsagia circumcincta]|uniref:Uncharacterized protein n=1 Tax=Teladorsagia circumcincta TaxID=45464 RepID=A0A2G9UZ69_TELCI|nr:hypothetical protein TELCIR_02406 [Teladorsagia circumcincta]
MWPYEKARRAFMDSDAKLRARNLEPEWCVAGLCVDNPKRLRECSDINEKTCRKYSKAKLRHYCKASEFKEICCRSCEQLKDL